MDLSVWAFEKLAKSNSIGVMGITFKRVPCDHRPANAAPPVASPSPAEAPWPGAKRPDQQVYVKRFDSVGGPQGELPGLRWTALRWVLPQPAGLPPGAAA
jgi:hypothetical protein